MELVLSKRILHHTDSVVKLLRSWQWLKIKSCESTELHHHTFDWYHTTHVLSVAHETRQRNLTISSIMQPRFSNTYYVQTICHDKIVQIVHFKTISKTTCIYKKQFEE